MLFRARPVRPTARPAANQSAARQIPVASRPVFAQALRVPTPSLLHTSSFLQAPTVRPKRKIWRDPVVVKKKPSNNPTAGFTQVKIDKGKNLYAVASSYFGIHPTTFGDVDESHLTNKEWRNSGFAVQTSKAASFWGVFPDVLQKFKPRINIKAIYTTPNGPRHVYRGNMLSPADLQNKPDIRFDCLAQKRFWSLLLVDADAPAVSKPTEKNLLHWLVVNIPGSTFSAGETIAEYIPPFQAEKTGLHRYVYVLAQHKEKLDSASLAKIAADTIHGRKSFNLSQFITTNKMKAKGVSFFIADWDKSCTDVAKALSVEPPVLKPPPEPKPSTKRKYSTL